MQNCAANRRESQPFRWCTSTDLALTLYNNRAACRQQMREPEAALADAAAVLAVEPANAKALARKAVCEQAIKAAA